MARLDSLARRPAKPTSRLVHPHIPTYSPLELLFLFLLVVILFLPVAAHDLQVDHPHLDRSPHLRVGYPAVHGRGSGPHRRHHFQRKQRGGGTERVEARAKKYGEGKLDKLRAGRRASGGVDSASGVGGAEGSAVTNEVVRKVQRGDMNTATTTSPTATATAPDSANTGPPTVAPSSVASRKPSAASTSTTPAHKIPPTRSSAPPPATLSSVQPSPGSRSHPGRPHSTATACPPTDTRSSTPPSVSSPSIAPSQLSLPLESAAAGVAAGAGRQANGDPGNFATVPSLARPGAGAQPSRAGSAVAGDAPKSSRSSTTPLDGSKVPATSPVVVSGAGNRSGLTVTLVTGRVKAAGPELGQAQAEGQGKVDAAQLLL